MTTYRLGFVMEQHVGHATYYQNLRTVVERCPDIVPTWVEVTYKSPGGLVERLPVLPERTKGVLRGALQVRQGLAGKSLDGLLFYTQSPAVFHRTLLCRIPTVINTDVTPRQYDTLAEHYGHRADGDDVVARYKHRANREVYDRAAAIVPWTNWVKTSLWRDYDVPDDKITVVPPGVDLRMWSPSAERGPATLPLQLLFVGSDFARKGGWELLRWFARYGRGRCVLHVVTKEAIPPMDGLFVYNDLTRNSPPLRRLYQQSDLFVLPSKGECFGYVYLEALASGLPVIATTVGGTADIVQNGVNGLRIEPTEDALAQALETFLERPELCRIMGCAARVVAEERFDATANGDRLLQVFRGVVNRWQRRPALLGPGK